MGGTPADVGRLFSWSNKAVFEKRKRGGEKLKKNGEISTTQKKRGKREYIFLVVETKAGHIARRTGVAPCKKATPLQEIGTVEAPIRAKSQ